MKTKLLKTDVDIEAYKLIQNHQTDFGFRTLGDAVSNIVKEAYKKNIFNRLKGGKKR